MTPWADYALTDGFIPIAAAYDLSSRKRVHPVYLWGGLLVVTAQVSRDLVGRTAAWHAVAHVLIG